MVCHTFADFYFYIYCYHMNEYIPQLEWRYATKQFDATKQVSSEQLHRILEAMRLAPSAYGIQPWKFYVVPRSDLRTTMLPLSYNQSQISDASHIIVVASKQDISQKDVEQYLESIKNVRNVTDESLVGFRQILINTVEGEMTDEEKNAWTAKQSYIALGFGLFACALEQVDACPMEGFDDAAISDLLGITAEGYHAQAYLAVGFRKAEDPYASLQKVRFDSEHTISFLS